jgi:hypothetical protein
MKILTSLLFCLLILDAFGQKNQQTNLPELQTFQVNKAILDLRNTSWVFVHDTTNKVALNEIETRKDWSPVKVGRNWDFVGHAELRKGTVWVKTRVFIPLELKDNTISFFCTLIGGSADLFINGQHTGEHVQYYYGNFFPGSTKIEISNVIRFGQENEILVRCDNNGAVRSIGLLGLVGLQRTVPFVRNSNGGIVTMGNTEGQFSVFLHYADAILSVGNKTKFSSGELCSMQIPAYGLREEEMICLVPSEQVDGSKLLKVDLSLMSFTSDNRPVTVKCEKLPSSLSQYQLMTLPLQVTARYNNPFEETEIDVRAEIVTPSGKIETIHGFFAQDYKTVSVGEFEEILLPENGLGTPWRINYRPREAGTYKVQLSAKDQSGAATWYAGSFDVTPKAEKGFLRVSKKDPRFFEFDNGDSFYATGPSGWFRNQENWMFGGNTRWVPVEQLKSFYTRKGANRSSFEYLARWHFGSMYLKGGFIDNYVMWKLDAAVRAMENNGVYWITYGKPAAGRTYFNNFKWGMEITSLQTQIVRQNGLPALSELEFEQGGRTELYHFVSRLADSPAIWIWNCAEEDGSFNPEVLPYHSYIRSLDVYKHPHGVSEGEDGIKYGGDAIILGGWYSTPYERLLPKYLPLTKFQFPVLEIEGSVNRSNDLYNMQGERVKLIENGYHNHLWLCLFMKMAAGGTDWFVVELDANNLMFHAKSISKYLDGESLTKIHWEMATPEVSDTVLNAFALKSDNKTMVWIIRPPSKRHTEAATPAVVNIPVEKNGKFLVEFWDTSKGEIVQKVNVESTGKMIKLKIDYVNTDIALKAILQ